MKNQAISVYGTTATGKSNFVFSELIPYFYTKKQHSGVAIISVDSRQVFKDLMIVSGADIPVDFVRTESGFFKEEAGFKVSIHGIDFLEFNQEWSLGVMITFVGSLIREAWRENKLVILVGGTGAYHRGVWRNEHEALIPPNEQLRQELAKLTVAQLQQQLRHLNPSLFSLLNNSDVNNSHRLVRKIEICQFELLNNTEQSPQTLKTDYFDPDSYQLVSLGLFSDAPQLRAAIESRVTSRLNKGAIHEVETLLRKIAQAEHVDYKMVLAYFSNWAKKYSILTTVGVAEITTYLQTVSPSETAVRQLILDWTTAENQYAKRRKNLVEKYTQPDYWFDTSKPKWQKSAINFLKKQLYSD